MTADLIALEALLDRMQEALQGGDLAALETLAGPLAEAGATLVLLGTVQLRVVCISNARRAHLGRHVDLVSI